MQAVWYERQGPADEVLEHGAMPTPDPAPGEVLVGLRASGINPSDVKLRAGSRPMGFPRIVPHSDGAGEIVAVGEGVDLARIGRRVWIWNGQWQRALGTAADHIALPSAQAVDLPEPVSFAEGACLGIPAVTAVHAVFADGSVAGQRVLVTGGAGSVARYAIEMAASDGAEVIATISGPEKAAIAREAGAAHTLDRRDPDLAEQVLALTGGHGVERIVECEFGANVGVSEKVIAIGGVIAAYGSAQVPEPVMPFLRLMFRHTTLRMPLIYLLSETERAAVNARLTGLLEAGVLSHRIAAEMPLASAAEAHRLIESGGRAGAVLLRMD
ncbi:MAG: NADPH:quinone reductase [Pseudomonadota bacterium]